MKFRRSRAQEKAPRSYADECTHVRTRAGRTAHLQHPDSPERVLCGWTTPHWQPDDDPDMHVCVDCGLAAEIEDHRRAR